MDQNWEWISCWRWTEQYFLLQWWCNFKQNYSICCYVVVSPGKVTRSHEFCCNIWVMGRSVFMTIASLFVLQQKESIFGPSREHPSSWNGADGPGLFNRCLAHPRLGCIVSKVTSGTHTAEWDVQHNTGFHSPIRIQTIHIAIISSAIGSAIYMLKFLRLKKPDYSLSFD